MMDYLASITYRNPVPPTQRSRGRRFPGPPPRRLPLPACGRTYAGGRGVCPIDSLELDEEHVVDLPPNGTITNFVIVTPVQYPGQTETEPFARVFVLLDGTDVVLSYQPVIELPVRTCAVGVRVSAVWASPAEETEGDAVTGA